MMESQENLLKKLEDLDQVLVEVRSVLSKTENNAIKKDSTKQDLEKIVESLRQENEVLKRDVDQLHVTLTDMKASKDYLLEKLEAVEQELKESRTLLSKKIGNSIRAELSEQDLQITVDSLQKEIKALKCDVENAVENNIKAQLAKQELKKSVDSLEKENKALKSEIDQLRTVQELRRKIEDSFEKQTVAPLKSLNKVEHPRESEVSKKLEASKQEIEQLKRKASEMESHMKKKDALIQNLRDQLDCERKVSMTQKINYGNVLQKLEASKQELEQFRLKNKHVEQHFSAEKIKQLIAKINILMNNCDVDNAIMTFTSYIIDANIINNFNLVQVFNKISSIKKKLKAFEDLLLLKSKNCNLITSTYNQINNIVDYPSLILYVEKKLLRFYYDNKYHLTALSLCDRLVRIRKCKDAWVYLVHGELLLLQCNYKGAREAFFCSLKFSKEGDPNLQSVYEKARKALEQEISLNVWTLFHSDVNTYPLPQKELHAKYKELIRCYHPDKQHGFVKQYKDLAEYMSKELTQAYRSLSKQ